MRCGPWGTTRGEREDLERKDEEGKEETVDKLPGCTERIMKWDNWNESVLTFKRIRHLCI